jgi:hypothetical protein
MEGGGMGKGRSRRGEGVDGGRGGKRGRKGPVGG